MLFGALLGAFTMPFVYLAWPIIILYTTLSGDLDWRQVFADVKDFFGDVDWSSVLAELKDLISSRF